MKILVTKGDERLLGKELDLTQKEDMLYFCENLKLEVLDTWDELHTIKHFADKKIKAFERLHLFVIFEEGLAFIDEIKLIKR